MWVTFGYLDLNTLLYITTKLQIRNVQFKLNKRCCEAQFNFMFDIDLLQPIPKINKPQPESNLLLS